ncbi:MAG TPA: hypothetical protein PK805_00400 [Acidovorax temperans]|jgi:hypothetical protein|nr:hypothetical protein [Acidovorax temperans]
MKQMTTQKFFIELLHQLKNYSDAAVLFTAIQQGAVLREFKVSTTTFALDLLGGCVNKWKVQRSLQRLSDLGVITLRIHENYRTHIKVDADAVRALLRRPLCEVLPGMRDESFEFLSDQDDEALRGYEQDASEVIKKVAQPLKPGPDQPSPDRPTPDESSAA